MVLSSFECWAICEPESEIREFSRPRNRSVDYFRPPPPESNFVSQSCYHGYSRVVDSNQNVQQESQPMDVVDAPPISSIQSTSASTSAPSRKRLIDFEQSDMQNKYKQPRLDVEGKLSKR